MTERIAADDHGSCSHKESQFVDRNWTPRMTELFRHATRDSLLPSRIVSHPEFGDAAHLIWTEQMDPENSSGKTQVFDAEPRKTN